MTYNDFSNDEFDVMTLEDDEFESFYLSLDDEDDEDEDDDDDSSWSDDDDDEEDGDE